MDRSNLKNWELISSALHSELDDQERLDLQKMKDGDVDTEKVMRESSQIKDGLKEVGALRQIDQQASWKMIHEKIFRQRFRKISLTVLKYAAVVLIAVSIGNIFPPFTKPEGQQGLVQLDVPVGQMAHITLADGTEVWLNSDSHLRYPDRFNRNQRDVYLDGEGFFKVVRNEKSPFKVKTGKMEVEVLGTSFNVSAYQGDDCQSVVLEEGKVQINQVDGQKLLELSPGQRAEKINASQFQVENVQTSSYTNWKDGIIVFEAESLGEIAKKLERWYNVEIRFESPELEQYKITGTILRNKPIHQTIQAIELLAPVRSQYLVQTNKRDIINIKKK